MTIAYTFTAVEGREPEMCSGRRVCLVTQPHMLCSCVPWKVRPKSTKQTIYARVAAAESRMNLQSLLSAMADQKCILQKIRIFKNRLRSHVAISMLFAKIPRY